ncbi:hypothetical protein [Amycolatopsis albispora]|uniref:hypothetical protein n=1 Tax=Amycolatopsis albispora TaxID=1804986 RepID=UPI0019666F86|nr:hypothetical protein [Amycolatopsis albispora]
MGAVLHTPYTRWTDDDGRGRRPVFTAVWVRLDALYARPSGTPGHEVAAGLDVTGEVPGRLHGWLSSVKGEWLGVVDFEMPYADGRRERLAVADQLVPAQALRPDRTRRSVAEQEPGVGDDRRGS